jgi:Tol biopolymer transport system component
MARETQITRGPGGRILTNCNVWSPDGGWIAYDTRSDPAGDRFDGTRIEMVNVGTAEVRVLYESKNGACCGVVTWHPFEPKVVFILGPEFPTPDWSYGPSHRQGVIVDVRNPGIAGNMDARDLVPPFTPGALRGGSHVHIWHPLGDWIGFTYDDALENLGRCIGVGVPGEVRVPGSHPRNHGGGYFSRLVAVNGQGLKRCCEEGWVGSTRSLAFQGELANGIREVFLVDAATGTGSIRRLTMTEHHRYPGIAGPRHWLRSSPDGSRIGFLKKDDAGVVQFWIVAPDGGGLRQVTRGGHPVASAFTWHPDGQRVAFVMNNAVCLGDTESGIVTELTEPTGAPIRPEACVISPDGERIAFVRHRDGANQICVVETT